MNEAREEAVGTVWVVLGGVLTFLLPAWILLTAVTIQLSPDLSGLDLLLTGLSESPADLPSHWVWLRGAWRAGLALAVLVLPLGAVVAGAAVGGRGLALRGARERLALDDEVRSDAVLQGVQLVARTEIDSDASELDAAGQVVLADPMRRVSAAVIDGLTIGAVSMGPYTLALGLVFGDVLAPEQSDPVLLAAAITALVLLMALTALQVGLLARDAQTLGKRWLRLRITRPDGSRATVGQVVGLRTLAWGLLLQVPVVGWLMLPVADLVYLIAGERHQTLHDRLANTIVIDLRAGQPQIGGSGERQSDMSIHSPTESPTA